MAAKPSATLSLKNLMYRAVIERGEHVVAVTREANGFAVWNAQRSEPAEVVDFKHDSSAAINRAVEIAAVRSAMVGHQEFFG